MKLSDTQLIVLSAAAQREDRGIALPPKLRGGAAQKFAAKLLPSGAWIEKAKQRVSDRASNLRQTIGTHRQT